MKTFNVAIVGATGAVGEVLLELLESRNFPVNNLICSHLRGRPARH